MAYCQSGGINSVTRPTKPHPLDGLFLQSFDHGNHEERGQKLYELYGNKPLMAEAAVAFVVLFTNFLNDPNFLSQGDLLRRHSGRVVGPKSRGQR